MERIAFKMKLKPGFEAEYKKRHNEIWPELTVHADQRGGLRLLDLPRFRDPHSVRSPETRGWPHGGLSATESRRPQMVGVHG